MFRASFLEVAFWTPVCPLHYLDTAQHKRDLIRFSYLDINASDTACSFINSDTFNALSQYAYYKMTAVTHNVPTRYFPMLVEAFTFYIFASYAPYDY